MEYRTQYGSHPVRAEFPFDCAIGSRDSSNEIKQECMSELNS